jgi:Fic family protein
VLSNLLLLRSGYSFVSCSSLESVIEHNKEAYYLALRRTQTTLGKDQADWEPWILFFLRSMRTQVERLREKLGARVRHSSILSPLAERLEGLIRERGTLSVAESVMETGANRNTLKDKFRELVKAGVVELHRKGRGSHYRPLR